MPNFLAAVRVEYLSIQLSVIADRLAMCQDFFLYCFQGFPCCLQRAGIDTEVLSSTSSEQLAAARKSPSKRPQKPWKLLLCRFVTCSQDRSKLMHWFIT